MSKKRTWTDEQLEESVPKNITLSGVLRDLGLVPAGGNYKPTGRKYGVSDNIIRNWLKKR